MSENWRWLFKCMFHSIFMVKFPIQIQLEMRETAINYWPFNCSATHQRKWISNLFTTFNIQLAKDREMNICKRLPCKFESKWRNHDDCVERVLSFEKLCANLIRKSFVCFITNAIASNACIFCSKLLKRERKKQTNRNQVWWNVDSESTASEQTNFPDNLHDEFLENLLNASSNHRINTIIAMHKCTTSVHVNHIILHLHGLDFDRKWQIPNNIRF